MIPVLIAPAYNRHDLLARMLESVDVEVGRTLVVDNGFSFEAPWLQPGVTVWRPPFTSIGYGGAINFGITQTAGEPWWMWASNDIVFHPGHLATVVERMDGLMDPLVITGGFTWGAINRAAIREIGMVDDWSFFPIYFDDNDYFRRAHLANVDWVEERKGWSHGDGEHPGSVTINSDPALKKANHKTFDENKARYIAKWGGLPGEEVYSTPWNEGGSVRTVRPDIDGRAMRVW